MFEGFTERARQVVTLAQENARAMNHGYVGTEHLLLGLLAEQEGLGARALASLGLSLEKAQAEVLRIVGPGIEESEGGQLPLTPRLRKVLELALREALSLGHNYIGTEHVLLGLVREGQGVGFRILLDQGITSFEVRDEIIRCLSKPRRPSTDTTADTTTVTFAVKPGQVWIDPNEIGWRVSHVEGNIVHLERTVVEDRHVKDLVCTFRQPNEPKPGTWSDAA